MKDYGKIDFPISFWLVDGVITRYNISQLLSAWRVVGINYCKPIESKNISDNRHSSRVLFNFLQWIDTETKTNCLRVTLDPWRTGNEISRRKNGTIIISFRDGIPFANRIAGVHRDQKFLVTYSMQLRSILFVARGTSPGFSSEFAHSTAPPMIAVFLYRIPPNLECLMRALVTGRFMDTLIKGESHYLKNSIRDSILLIISRDTRVPIAYVRKRIKSTRISF